MQYVTYITVRTLERLRIPESGIRCMLAWPGDLAEKISNRISEALEVLNQSGDSGLENLVGHTEYYNETVLLKFSIGEFSIGTS